MELIYILLILNIITLIILLAHISNCSQCVGIEGMETVELQPKVDSDVSTEGINNIASLYQGKKLIVDDLMVTGNLQVQGDTGFGKNMKIYGNSNAQDKIQIFKNGNNKAPFFYANKQGQFGFHGEGNNYLKLGNTRVKGHFQAHNGSDFRGGRHFFQDQENAGRLRVGGVWGKPGIYAEDGKNSCIGASGGNMIVQNDWGKNLMKGIYQDTPIHLKYDIPGVHRVHTTSHPYSLRKYGSSFSTFYPHRLDSTKSVRTVKKIKMPSLW
jgi:hypothetical protein